MKPRLLMALMTAEAPIPHSVLCVEWQLVRVNLRDPGRLELTLRYLLDLGDIRRKIKQ